MQNNIVRAASVLALLFLLLSSCSKHESTAPPARPLATVFPIDGVVDLPSVGLVHEKTVDILDTFDSLGSNLCY